MKAQIKNNNAISKVRNKSCMKNAQSSALSEIMKFAGMFKGYFSKDFKEIKEEYVKKFL